MMIYEQFPEMDKNYYTFRSTQQVGWSQPLSLHLCFEILVVTKGTVEYTVGNKTKQMQRNDAVLVFPHQPHKMYSGDSDAYTVCCFDGSLIHYFAKKHDGYLPEDPFITLSPALAEMFIQARDSKNICAIKGCLYSICAMLEHSQNWHPRTKSPTDGLLIDILEYVEKNYGSDCDLSDLAATLSYNPSYIAKLFIRHVGMSFREFVMQRRVREACYMLSNTDLSVLEISVACGFRSLRTFNRNFRDITGYSPTDMISGQKK